MDEQRKILCLKPVSLSQPRSSLSPSSPSLSLSLCCYFIQSLSIPLALSPFPTSPSNSYFHCLSPFSLPHFSFLSLYLLSISFPLYFINHISLTPLFRYIPCSFPFSIPLSLFSLIFLSLSFSLSLSLNLTQHLSHFTYSLPFFIFDLLSCSTLIFFLISLSLFLSLSLSLSLSLNLDIFLIPPLFLVPIFSMSFFFLLLFLSISVCSFPVPS
ncbi:unnamed protein product [Acanthosepion pharaonis]|uniref:Uncharacterized protein n=1 Tax=Acanthosepion pharaonis TaxID=158019 RepID=A0A812AJR9_ACAPH|nr:unnamed protein product [Sepia pharaonis]